MATSNHHPPPSPQNQYSELLMENLGILCRLQIWLNHPHPPESVLRTSSVDFRYGCIKPPFHPHPFQYNNLEPLMENLKDILCEHYDMATTPLPPNPELELLMDDLEFSDMTTTEYSPRIPSSFISLGLGQYECTTTNSNSPIISILYSCKETHYSFSFTVYQLTLAKSANLEVLVITYHYVNDFYRLRATDKCYVQ